MEYKYKKPLEVFLLTKKDFMVHVTDGLCFSNTLTEQKKLPILSFWGWRIFSQKNLLGEMIQLWTYYFRVHLAAEILDAGICFLVWKIWMHNYLTISITSFAKPCVFIIQNEQRQLRAVLQSSTAHCLESESRRCRSAWSVWTKIQEIHRNTDFAT